VKDTSIWSGLNVQLSWAIATHVWMRPHGRALAGQLEVPGERPNPDPNPGGWLMELLIALMIVVGLIAALAIAVLWTDLRE
jgi:hypothetical protein